MKKIVFYAIILWGIKSFAQDKIIDSLKLALVLSKEDTIKVNILDEISGEYVFKDPDSAIKYSQMGLALAKKLNFERRDGTLLWNLAFALSNLGDYPSSLYYWYQDITASAKLKDTFQLGFNYLGMSNCYRDQSDYSNAQSSIDKARRLSIARNDHTLSWFCDRVQSIIYVETDKLDSASFYINRAHPLEQNSPWGYTLYIKGAIQEKSGHDSIALFYYRQAISVGLGEGNQKDLVDYYNALSQLFWNEKKTDSAIHYASLIIGGKLGRTHRIGILHSSNLLAKIYESEKKSDSAIKYLNLTVSLKDSLFSQQKTREAQNFAFYELLQQQELQQKLEQNKLEYRSRLNIFILLSGLILLTGVVVGLWRRNIFKQRSYALLEKQKMETDEQKIKVEKALSELKMTQAQLIQSEKMASLGEMTAGIAHEIQNPLNFVNNFAEVNAELIDEAELAIDAGNPEDVKKLLKSLKDNHLKINQHGQRADAIVKGMLQHSRISTGQKEPTDINTLGDEYLRLSFHGFRAKDKDFNAAIQTDFDPTVGKVSLIPQDIGRVLLNLYNNAFYAVSEKKRKQTSGFEPTVTVSTKRMGNKIEISVRDNGNGIPQKVMDKIFQPFFTTKPAGQGTGLGLSLSYDIVKAHGGDITVDTKEGEYTEFAINLP